MIDPSSSEEESEEDQSPHPGGGSGGRGSSHGSHRHPGGRGGGGGSLGGSGGSGSVGSVASGLTASPGGPNHVGPPASSGHGVGHGRVVGGSGGQHEASAGSGNTGSAGLDVPDSRNARNSLSPSMSAAQDAANYAQRPTSPSPSVASEKTEAELQVRVCLGTIRNSGMFLHSARNRRVCCSRLNNIGDDEEIKASIRCSSPLCCYRINKNVRRKREKQGYNFTCSSRDVSLIHSMPNNPWT